MEADNSNSHLTEWAALTGDRVPEAALEKADERDDSWRITAR